MILYRATNGYFVEQNGNYYLVDASTWSDLVNHVDLLEYLSSIVAKGVQTNEFNVTKLLAPIDSQEVWASGVTYYRSRSARIEESKDAGGGDFYDRVYSAERPELFFKAVASKVAGPNSNVNIRSDATWSVPEPELVLLVNSRRQIVGYTIGNDVSSRDIEGANPLYLPQAKVYDRSCALGPGVLVQKNFMPRTTEIRLSITRTGAVEFSASTTLAELKRDPQTLVEYLYRDQSFADGCFLFTGTGIVPPDSFTLQSQDLIEISIDNIGTLANTVS